MNGWILISTLCVALAPGLKGEPGILVCPFEGFDGRARSGVAMTLAVYDAFAHAPQLIPFSQVRNRMRDVGLPLNASLSVATRITLARELGANLVLHGQMGESDLSFTVLDLDSSALSQWTLDVPEGDASLCLLSRDITKLLGFDEPIETMPSDEFYRVLASTYAAMPADVAFHVFWKLLEHHPSSFFLFTEFQDRFDPPQVDTLAQPELVFWRNVFHRHGAYADALPFSSALLGRAKNGDAYGVHAVILFELGNREIACRYLKMALAYGATTTDLEHVSVSCGIELASGDGDPIGSGSQSLAGK